tara:strand:- start:283 stop:384 length:102 start_codon:yes stop_codon:yes gene_type:complete
MYKRKPNDAKSADFASEVKDMRMALTTNISLGK